MSDIETALEKAQDEEAELNRKIDALYRELAILTSDRAAKRVLIKGLLKAAGKIE